MKTAPAIAFDVRISWQLTGTTLVVGLLVLLALQLIPAPPWLRHGLHFVALAYLVMALVRLLRPPVKSILWRAEGGVDITLRDSTLQDGRPVLGAISSARVIGPLIVLTLRWPSRERAHLWLLPDNLDADTRRRLRMRLGAGGVCGITSGNADSR
ncbi:MAG TPA: protein YgfX [Rhodanobacteraceae bacterium]